MKSGKPRNDAVDLMSEHTAHESAVLRASEWNLAMDAAKGSFAPRAVRHFVVSTPRVTLEQHSVLLLKLLSNRFCLQFACQIAGKAFQLGHALLKAFIFINDHLKLSIHKRQVVTQDISARVLGNELFSGSQKFVQYDNGGHGLGQGCKEVFAKDPSKRTQNP